MNDARARYVADAVATASPARLLTMLYDRLLLDLARASDALAAGDRAAATPFVDHAVDVVSELMSTLDTGAWDGAARLMSIYEYVLSELLRAGVAGDAEVVAECRRVLEPLASAWHQAADEAGRVPAPHTEPVPLGVLGVG